ncbi:MAG TPA: DNA/RNA non-specific endonuclease [Polyangiaceae bacterium]|nr:DNA/RNA non-specific endonuclease [Polyangiaceae bacterium]
MVRRTTASRKATKTAVAVSILALVTTIGSVWCGGTPDRLPKAAASNPPETVPGAGSSSPAASTLGAPERRRSFADSIAGSPHIALGVPADADSSDDILLDEQAYVVSYNPTRNGPNWVAWQLDRSHFGLAHRRDDFRSDPLLPALSYHVEPRDYTRSGYDRGHMCPSADRTRDAEQNSLTFLMTNILPQVHELNDGPWKKLEEYERVLANEADAQLYIVAGGIFADTQPVIGPGISVPTANYKIIVALRTSQTATDVGSQTKVVAAVMPNNLTAGGHAWTDFLTSVDEVETATGYDFLSRVAEATQRVIEASVFEPAAAPKRRSPRRTLAPDGIR